MNKHSSKFAAVIDYIDNHIEQKITLDQLARVACLSKYHFSRVFSTFFGMSVISYIQKTRLHRAAFQLAFRKHLKVIDIALLNQFKSAEAFSRAFKLYTGQSPTDFRKHTHWDSWHNSHIPIIQLRSQNMKIAKQNFEVTIVSFSPVKVAVKEHRGAPQKLPITIASFIEWRKKNKLPPQKSRTFNLVYNDPDNTNADEFRFDLCAEIKLPIDFSDTDIVEKTIPQGSCATIRHIGPDYLMKEKIEYLYGQWLEENNQELRDFPLFFERVKFFPDVAENQMITDIYLPIKA